MGVGDYEVRRKRIHPIEHPITTLSLRHFVSKAHDHRKEEWRLSVDGFVVDLMCKAEIAKSPGKNPIW